MNKKLTSLAIVLLAGSAQAAIINWGAPTDTTGLASFSSNGDFEYGLNGGGGSPTVAGNLYSTNSAFGNVTGTFLNFAAGGSADTGDTDLNTLLAQGTFSSNPGTGNFSTDNTVTLAGLTPGQEYEVQLFFVDLRFDSLVSDAIVSAGGNQVTLDNNPGAGLFGQNVIGTFTADAVDPVITVIVNDTNDRGSFNAIQVRAIPEPSTSLLAFVASALFLRRKR